MGLYFVEGLLSSIKAHKNILNDFSFVLFPTINRAGIENNNHRLTPTGIDLNRQWNRNCPEINNIKQEIHKLNNIYAIIDIHGDEVSKKDYIIYNKNFENIKLKKIVSDEKFELLKKQCFLKKFLKTLVRSKKIIKAQGCTARDYFENAGLTALTIELSAHSNTPQTCFEKGYNIIKKMER